MRAAISRTITGALTSHALRDFRRGWNAMARRLRGRMAEIHYFHQSDDPYSHLTAQVLAKLAARYDAAVVPHLAAPPDDGAAPERERLAAWSLRDAGALAARLGLDWPEHPVPPTRDAVAAANAGLAAALATPDFAARAVEIGAALWRGDGAALTPHAVDGNAEAAARAMAEGAKLREEKGHYLGGTFYFEGEWYWGVDRLHYLETRLRGAGLAKGADEGLIAPVKDVELTAQPANGARPELHFFFSFRSPYTYISVPRVRRLAKHYGADLKLRFILPMVMRGLPVPRAKSMYIMRDTKREADRVGLPFGRIVDPVGLATERGIAVLNHAIPMGRGPDFAESFLRAVWSEGVDATTEAGLNTIAARAGLQPDMVAAALLDDSWRAPAEVNRQDLFAMGLWGAPSLRVNDGPGYWGQDRLWLIERDLIAATAAK
ncbi:MAG: DsbA family protein [Alphaproteobacteria bacterium]